MCTFNIQYEYLIVIVIHEGKSKRKSKFSFLFWSGRGRNWIVCYNHNVTASICCIISLLANSLMCFKKVNLKLALHCPKHQGKIRAVKYFINSNKAFILSLIHIYGRYSVKMKQAKCLLNEVQKKTCVNTLFGQVITMSCY